MAKLRGGSTVGGNPIISLDAMNDVIYQLTNIELASKMNKSEQDKMTDFSKTDSYIKDKNKNGFWQVENATNTTGIINNNNGLIANLSNDNARFQLFASNKSNEESTLYFRTGFNDDIKDWRKVVTDTILENSLNSKFDKNGGDITGNVEATDYISTNSFLRTKKNNDFLKMYISSNNEANYEASSNVTKHNFNKAVNVNGNITVNNSNAVYHTGIFNYEDLLKKNIQSTTQTDVSRLLDSGFYCGTFTYNCPVNNSTVCYIEVTTNDDKTRIIQKVYASNGKSYFRVRNNNTWTQWFTLGGTLSYSREISESSWSEVDGMYEITICHNLNCTNVTSVIVTDSDNISMFTGFKITSSSTIKIYCSSAVDGKIIINMNQI